MHRRILRYQPSTRLTLGKSQSLKKVGPLNELERDEARPSVVAGLSQAASRGTLCGLAPQTCASRRGSRSQISRLIFVISWVVRTISCRRPSSSAFISPNLRLDLVSINRIDCVWVMAPEESKMNMQ